MREAAVLFFHLPDPIEAHRDYRQCQIFCQHSNPRLKWRHPAVIGIVDLSFRKDQHRVAAIRGFTRKTETLPKTRKLRQRENIEQHSDQYVAELVRPALRKKPFAWWNPHAAQRLATHRRRESVPKSLW